MKEFDHIKSFIVCAILLPSFVTSQINQQILDALSTASFSSGVFSAPESTLASLKSSSSSNSIQEMIFPSLQEEYDPWAFDPNSFFGSPYGGYGRATKSRLAKLPLRLTTSFIETESEEGTYFTMRDGEGKQFACKSYNHNELEYESLFDSMFDIAKERNSHDYSYSHADSDGNDNVNDAVSQTDNDKNGIVKEGQLEEGMNKNEFILDERNLEDKDNENSNNFQDNPKISSLPLSSTEAVATALGAAVSPMPPTPPPPFSKGTRLKMKINDNLHNQLRGVCAQFHKDWWSYEWCHEDRVVQFHIALNNGSEQQQQNSQVNAGDVTSVTVEDLTPLGSYKSRKVSIDNDDTLSEITDTFKDGAFCEGADKHRSTKVQLSCCEDSPDIQSFYNDQLLGGSSSSLSSSATSGVERKQIGVIFQKIEENEICEYTATICTSLLCSPMIDDLILSVNNDEDERTNTDEPSTMHDKYASTSPPRNERSLTKKESHVFQRDDSIREILDKALGFQCLSMNAGWWTYGFCHKTQIYQFHEDVVLDPLTAKANTNIESRYVLGKYDKESSEDFPVENESKHMHLPHHDTNDGMENRSSDSARARKKRKKNQNTGIPDAFFSQEYYHGDTCEGSDVVDSAIKGGRFGDGKIERSSTVRFFCGSQKAIIRVDEDSTCHYIVDISVPELCIQKYFEVPHLKTQVIKCLPVD